MMTVRADLSRPSVRLRVVQLDGALMSEPCTWAELFQKWWSGSAAVAGLCDDSAGRMANSTLELLCKLLSQRARL